MNVVMRIVRKLIRGGDQSDRTILDAKLHVQTAGQNISMTVGHTSELDGVNEQVSIQLSRDDAQRLVRQLISHFSGVNMNDMAKVLSLAQMANNTLRDSLRADESIRAIEQKLREARLTGDEELVAALKNALNRARDAASNMRHVRDAVDRISNKSFEDVQERLDKLFGVVYGSEHYVTFDSRAADKPTLEPRGRLGWPDEEDDWGN